MNNKTLAEFYIMTGKSNSHSEFTKKLTESLSESKKIVQLKSKNIADPDEYLALVNIAQALCKQFDAILLLATSVTIFEQTNADGLHLNSQMLGEYVKRPISSQLLLSVSCHNLQEMKQAEQLGADILLVSPVKATASHPELEGIGWQQFSQMIKQVNSPVYALGGMKISDLEDAKQAGAQGVSFSV